jgi:hypothetical protein
MLSSHDLNVACRASRAAVGSSQDGVLRNRVELKKAVNLKSAQTSHLIEDGSTTSMVEAKDASKLHGHLVRE